ncbi:hypothetical protein CapIbe_021142 [Capra ibex]
MFVSILLLKIVFDKLIFSPSNSTSEWSQAAVKMITLGSVRSDGWYPAPTQASPHACSAKARCRETSSRVPRIGSPVCSVLASKIRSGKKRTKLRTHTF